MTYDILMPVAERSLTVLPLTVENAKKNLNAGRIYVAANKRLREEILQLGVDFADEDLLIDGLSYDVIRDLIVARKPEAAGRTGWYLQQFLKMGYACICNDPYYLVWDADTLPLKPITMFFPDGRPVFDMKQEYHPPYFQTMESLFAGTVGKTGDASYISEHMIMSVDYMKQMLAEIEDNDALPGTRWFEKIMHAVNAEDLAGSGFSEFETYGNYVETRHPGAYHYRELKTFRRGEELLSSNVSEAAKQYVFQTYDTISFENRGSLI